MNLFLIRQLREAARTSLWILPGAAAALAVLLAKTLPIAEAVVPHGDSAWYLFPGQPDSARELLSTIASAMMTFTGLVFSITILVLQLASSQFSPRVLHAFLSDRSTRLAMACFVGTFVYALALLPEVRSVDATGGERVPAFSVFFAFVLVLVSVGVFVHYIHRMAHSIRAVDILRRVADEAVHGLDELYPEEPEAEPAPAFELPNRPPDQVVSNGGSGGVVAAVDEDALVAAAHESDVVVEVVPALGDFVVRGGPLLRVWGATRLDPERMKAHVAVADERTSKQDPAFAFRQLVDIAERALSPGTNDPTTAVQALDRIHDLLMTLANRRFPPGWVVDSSGKPRLFVPRPDWDELVHLAFDEIRQYGAGSIQVVRRLRAALDELTSVCTEDRRAVLEVQRRALDDTARRFTSPTDRARAAQPSAQGQGNAPLNGRRADRLRERDA